MNKINLETGLSVPDFKVDQSVKQSQNAVPAKGAGFLETLEKTLEVVNEDQNAADNSIKDLIAGKSKNIHETLLTVQKADLSLKTMMQVRNKILEAYKEIMRMQV